MACTWRRSRQAGGGTGRAATYYGAASITPTGPKSQPHDRRYEMPSRPTAAGRRIAPQPLQPPIRLPGGSQWRWQRLPALPRQPAGGSDARLAALRRCHQAVKSMQTVSSYWSFPVQCRYTLSRHTAPTRKGDFAGGAHALDCWQISLRSQSFAPRFHRYHQSPNCERPDRLGHACRPGHNHC